MSEQGASDSPSETQQRNAADGILPAQHWQDQQSIRRDQNDFDDNDDDSAVGTDTETSTASITSSILEYRELHGRRFHGERGTAQYWGSNDEAANESMDINHHAISIALGDKIHLAPLQKENVKKALDIGTGTGIWAVDFADEYPGAEVIGTDISAIQPTWVPPNLRFEIEDCTQEWTFHAEDFDYVHIRWLTGSIRDWDALIEQAYRVLKPGGYLETLEVSPVITSDDGSVSETSALGQWGKFFIAGGDKLGRTFRVVEQEIQRKSMEKVGFTELEEFNFKMPIGGWAKDPKMKELGQYGQLVIESDIEGYIIFMANALGWTREEILVYISMLRREIRAGAMHPFYRQKAVWGRKPLK